MDNPKKQLFIKITVGYQEADIIGNDNKALQAAIDYVAALGGGLVEIGPGIFIINDSVHLRTKVTLRGQRGRTIFLKSDAIESPLSLDGDFGEKQITLKNPVGFKPGIGISIIDNQSSGFHTTVGTISWACGNTFGVNIPLGSDYLVNQNARAATTFPVISCYHTKEVKIENITVQGNKIKNSYLNGCRGAGIFLFQSHGTELRNCKIIDYRGDGISFQQSNSVLVENCISSGNTHLGLHPGSGSKNPSILNCKSMDNGRIGLFLCWRVKNGHFENNDLIRNSDSGVSIGHKDTDNLFRSNRINDNGKEGILFRDESEPMGGHRNRFEKNEILNNGKKVEGYGVRILGETHDLTFIENHIGNDTKGKQQVGVYINGKASHITLRNNDISGNLNQNIKDERREA